MGEIKRDLFDNLVNHLSKKEISLIVGPRQSGKTTLMKKLKKYLDEINKKSVYLNLDYEGDSYFFESQEKLIQKIKLEIGEEGFVFIDEIQKKQNAGIFLKGIYDLDLKYKFILSGSGSLELKEKIHESLAGRKRVFECFPVSFKEFVNYKTDYKYEDNLVNFLYLEKEIINNLLIEYLNFGGYPRVILEHEMSEKKYIIDEIYKSYVLKDISYLLKIEKSDSFIMMLKILASQIGQIVKYSELSKQVGISEQTLKNYIYYAENTFCIMKLSPFFRNKQKEITKSPIIYFNDLGLRNYVLGLMGIMNNPNNLGYVFQNFVYKLLIEKFYNSNINIKYWRTLNMAEVDFVIENGQEIIPIEIKYSNFKRPEITRSLRNFIEKYNPKKAYIISPSYSNSINIGHTIVEFKPFGWIYGSEAGVIVTM